MIQSHKFKLSDNFTVQTAILDVIEDIDEGPWEYTKKTLNTPLSEIYINAGIIQ